MKFEKRITHLKCVYVCFLLRAPARVCHYKAGLANAPGSYDVYVRILDANQQISIRIKHFFENIST